jgi:hypothetical protein
MPLPVRALASERCPMVRDGPRSELARDLADASRRRTVGQFGTGPGARGVVRRRWKAKGPGPELGGGTSLDGPGFSRYRHDGWGT